MESIIQQVQLKELIDRKKKILETAIDKGDTKVVRRLAYLGFLRSIGSVDLEYNIRLDAAIALLQGSVIDKLNEKMMEEKTLPLQHQSH